MDVDFDHSERSTSESGTDSESGLNSSGTESLLVAPQVETSQTESASETETKDSPSECLSTVRIYSSRLLYPAIS